jgi:hypothetical protein
VESCTVVVEHWDGGLELIRWTEAQYQDLPSPGAVPVPERPAAIQGRAA